MGPNYPGYAGRCIFPCCLLQFRINQGQVYSEVENKSRVPRQGPKSEWGKNTFDYSALQITKSSTT